MKSSLISKIFQRFFVESNTSLEINTILKLTKIFQKFLLESNTNLEINIISKLIKNNFWN